MAGWALQAVLGRSVSLLRGWRAPAVGPWDQPPGASRWVFTTLNVKVTSTASGHGSKSEGGSKGLEGGPSALGPLLGVPGKNHCVWRGRVIWGKL